VNLMMGNDQDKENVFSMMANLMMVCGKMIKDMVRVLRRPKQGLNKLDYGKMMSLCNKSSSNKSKEIWHKEQNLQHSDLIYLLTLFNGLGSQTVCTVF